MYTQFKAFWLPKRGNNACEYEDAFWPQENDTRVLSNQRFAIADGATETSFAATWANILVRRFSRRMLRAANFVDDIQMCRKIWQRTIPSRPLPWYAEEKAKLGAYAALLGITFSNESEDTGAWDAIAAGDCCLFQLRNGELISSFPMSSSAEFSSRPYLLGSTANGCPENQESEKILRDNGTYRSGDRFLLMTDALAAWFLRTYESNSNCIEKTALIALEADVDFEKLVENARNSILEDGTPSLRNDDTTLVIVKVCE